MCKLTKENSHTWGDSWNGEDLSIYSEDDPVLPTSNASTLITETSSIDQDSPSYSKSNISEATTESPSTLRHALTPDTMVSSPAASDEPIKRGFRAGEAFVRPWPFAINGTVDSFGFDLKSCTFTLKLISAEATPEDSPTEIFVPAWHFPNGNTQVEVSGGKWKMVLESDVQKLKWWHAAGEQTVTLKGMIRKRIESDGDGYYEQWMSQLPTISCDLM
jgi:hypothetical protein